MALLVLFPTAQYVSFDASLEQIIDNDVASGVISVPM